MDLKKYEEFGQKIKDYTDQKGITLNEFAESIGMSGVTMHRIVKGRIVVHAPMIIKIIKAMGMDVDEEMKEMFGAV
jgi:plasmid maintenance system antidote protein VapI